MPSKYIALPKGVSEKAFDAAIREYREILGEANVFTDEGHLVSYSKIMIPDSTENHQPSAAICPASTEEVQLCVAVCNKYKVPVWPISTGRNLGYGSAAPGSRGQVVMDLRRMNKIIEVDRELGTALVEPGVTFQQLYDYLQEHKIPLWLSCPAPSSIAGPLGNAADRGVGYTPYGEHFMFSCGMEVVMPTGELLKTGMGGLPNSNTAQVFKWGYGPYLDGIFTQSNFGIITKMGFWLMPAPPAFKPYVIRYPEETDIVDIVETLRPLRMAMVIPNAVVIVHALWELGSFLKRADHYEGAGSIPDAVVNHRAAAEQAIAGQDPARRCRPDRRRHPRPGAGRGTGRRWAVLGRNHRPQVSENQPWLKSSSPGATSTPRSPIRSSPHSKRERRRGNVPGIPMSPGHPAQSTAPQGGATEVSTPCCWVCHRCRLRAATLVG